MIKSFLKTGIGIATTFMSITFLTSCSNSSLSTDIINGSDMSIKESILNLEIPEVNSTFNCNYSKIFLRLYKLNYNAL